MLVGLLNYNVMFIFQRFDKKATKNNQKSYSNKHNNKVI